MPAIHTGTAAEDHNYSSAVLDEVLEEQAAASVGAESKVPEPQNTATTPQPAETDADTGQSPSDAASTPAVMLLKESDSSILDTQTVMIPERPTIRGTLQRITMRVKTTGPLITMPQSQRQRAPSFLQVC